MLAERLHDESALLEDLLVHVRNVTFSKLVGKEAPFRRPTDLTVPRLVMHGEHFEIIGTAHSPERQPGRL
jgi:hypothetical protein